MKDEQFLNRVIQRTTDEIAKRVEFIRNYSTVPIGREKLTSAQFRQKYGISVREAQRMDKKYGPEVVQEVLDALGGGQNALTQ